MRAQLSESPLTSDDVWRAVLVAVCELKSQAKRRDRKETEIIDDCVAMAEAMIPTAEDLRAASIAAIHQHKLCAETLADFERIRPLVKVLTSDAFTGAPQRR